MILSAEPVIILEYANCDTKLGDQSRVDSTQLFVSGRRHRRAFYSDCVCDRIVCDGFFGPGEYFIDSFKDPLLSTGPWF
jgi:hypothetical protein